jgi:hypothetical protein
LLAIANTEEGDFFVDPSNPGVTDVTWTMRQFFPTLTPEQVSQAAEVYAPTSEINAFEQARRAVGEGKHGLF